MKTGNHFEPWTWQVTKNLAFWMANKILTLNFRVLRNENLTDCEYQVRVNVNLDFEVAIH